MKICGRDLPKVGVFDPYFSGVLYLPLQYRNMVDYVQNFGYFANLHKKKIFIYSEKSLPQTFTSFIDKCVHV